MTELRPMTSAEFARWLDQAVADYADDKRRALDIPAEAALTLSERSFADLLPEGLATPDHRILAAVAGEVVVGMVWIALRRDHGRVECFIYDIVVEEAHRRKGHGRAMLAAVDRLAKDMGADKVALHVFGDNPGAIALYRSAGYRVTDLTMVKPLV